MRRGRRTDLTPLGVQTRASAPQTCWPAAPTNTLTSIITTATPTGTPCTITVPNHFYPVDCSECHATPAWTGAVTTGADYKAAWSLVHAGPRMRNPSTCNLCHVGQDCGM